jgi:anti-sigma B factor antagonist
MDSPRGFGIDVQHVAPGVILLALTGEVDLGASFQLMESIIEAFHERPALILVDLSDVRFMDAAGLGVLAEGARHVHAAGKRLAVVRPSGHVVTGLLQLAGLEPALHVHESANEALERWLDGEAGANTSKGVFHSGHSTDIHHH